jgi:hypothetical protein
MKPTVRRARASTTGSVPPTDERRAVTSAMLRVPVTAYRTPIANSTMSDEIAPMSRYLNAAMSAVGSPLTATSA